MDGILLVDKPASWTSHDVVAKVRSIIKAETGQKVKVGHTGTLDPMATGLLILVIGSYTKRASDFSKLDKVYEAELTLGATSTTGDAEGQIAPKLTRSSQNRIRLEEVEQALRQFTGKIQQTPHVYSAIKVGGKKSYEMARKGQDIQLEPREVTIYQITDVKYDYPKLSFTTKVSSGTYIRSLAEGIGETLGTGAYLSSLRRTQVGNLDINDALGLGEANLGRIQKHLIQDLPKE